MSWSAFLSNYTRIQTVLLWGRRWQAKLLLNVQEMQWSSGHVDMEICILPTHLNVISGRKIKRKSCHACAFTCAIRGVDKASTASEIFTLTIVLCTNHSSELSLFFTSKKMTSVLLNGKHTPQYKIPNQKQLDTWRTHTILSKCHLHGKIYYRKLRDLASHLAIWMRMKWE